MNTITISSLFEKQPATLEYLASWKIFQCCEKNEDTTYVMERVHFNEKNMLRKFLAYDSRAFQFVIIDKVIEKDNIDISELENTANALLDSEFEKIYFYLLRKLIINTRKVYGLHVKPIVPVTKHFYEKLINEQIIHQFIQCPRICDLLQLLLLLAGDVETNPGPTYKEQCRSEYKKSKYFKHITERKQYYHDLKQIKIEEQPIIRREKFESREVQMQMLSGLSAAAGIYTTLKTSKFLDTAHDSVDKVTNQILDTLKGFQNTLGSIKEFTCQGINILQLLSDIFLAILQISFARKGRKLASLGVELFRMLSKYGLSMEFIGTVKDYLYGENRVVQMQVDIPEFEISPQTLTMFIFTILSVVFTTALPKAGTIEGLLKRLGDLGRSAKGIKDLNSVMSDSMSTAIDYFKEEVLGIKKTVEIENFISGIDRWFDEVRGLMQRTENGKKSDLILKDTDTIIEVENLYKQGLEFSREISDKKLTRELQLPFQTHMKLMTDLMKLVDTSGAFGTKPRTQPVVIWLFGESGVGKSGMSWPLAVDLNNLFVHNKEEARQFSKNIYMRNVEQEFWDNYQGQNIVIYDDFGQRKDSSASPNEEFMELIRTANIAPYPLHMAHLEDKRKTRFTSKVLLLTSNLFEHSVNSLTFPDAFRRRIDLCARVTNKIAFTKPGYSKLTNSEVRRLDKDKVRSYCGKIISTDVYELELVNPETGETIESGLSYEEFVARAEQMTINAFKSSQEMNEFLEEYAESRFASMQIDDLDAIDDAIRNEILTGKLPIFYCGKMVKMEDVLPELQEEYFDEDEHVCEDVNEWCWLQIKNRFMCRLDKIYKRLIRAKSYAMMKLYTWKTNMIEYITQHPFRFAIGFVSTLCGIFALSGLWSKVMGYFRQKQTKDIANFIKGNIIYQAYEAQVLDFDFTGMTLSQIIAFLKSNKLEKDVLHVKMDCRMEQVEHILEFMAQNVFIYTSKIVNHGRIFNLEAKPSGDSMTLKQQAVKVEAKPSGDSVMLKQTNIRVEAKPSGDSVTLKQPNIKIEAKPSGDSITLKQPKITIESSELVDAEMQMWKDQVAQNLITHRIFANLYKIGVQTPAGVKQLLHGLFVRGNCMLVPGHLLGFLDKNDTIEIVNAFDVKFTLPMKDIIVKKIKDSVGNDKEAALLCMPAYVMAHSDIVKHFSDSTSMQQYKRASTCLPLIRYSDKFSKFLVHIMTGSNMEVRDAPLNLIDDSKGTFVLRKGLLYEAPTMAGDCGAPLIINETKVLRKIAGIHVAGDSTGMAYAESITSKDLERCFQSIPVEMQIQVDFDQFIREPQGIKIEFDRDIDPEIIAPCMLPSLKFNPIGKCKDEIFEPAKTEIQPSLLFGKISDIKTKPAHLRNIAGINIKHKNLGKCAMDTPYIPKDLIDEVYPYVRNKWLHNVRQELRRVLTWEESIVGSDMSEYVGPINRSSSPGYPWIKQRKSGFSGKTGWFGKNEYILSEEVRLAVQERIDLARKGIRKPTVWIDTLKDERRPIEKVDQLKTRVFSNGPMDYSIAFRQYFLSFIAHLMENRIYNEVSIGTNVYSQDWKKTALYLREKGKKVIAGDFSTFDGTLNSCLMDKFVDLANDFYDDGEENALIRRVLFKDIYNSVHLCNGNIYMMSHSQPSGNPATTPLNCFINSMGVRICFVLAAKRANLPYTVRDFNSHVNLVSYGDDNVINFSDVIAPWFNMDTITAAFNDIGFIYTDETKSAQGTAPLWKTLEEVAYLKRNFRYDQERGVWEAPLLMDTILEMPNWCRGSLDIEEGTKVNAENAIMELSMHPKDVFDKWSTKICKEFYNATGSHLEVMSYKGYARQRYMDYYL